MKLDSVSSPLMAFIAIPITNSKVLFRFQKSLRFSLTVLTLIEIQQRVDQNSPMASPTPPNKLPSFSSRVADKMTDSPRGAPQSPVGIVRGDSDMTEADGGQSPDFCETESFVNEEDKPSSPYPPAVRARLRRIKPQS